MAEETTTSAADTAVDNTTVSQTSDSGSQPTQSSEVAAGKAKLQGQTVQAKPQEGGEQSKDTGKPETAPEDKAETKVEDKAAEKPAESSIDPDDLEWALKVGLDPKAPDFQSKLMKSYRESQKEMSRAKQAEEKARKTQEILESAKKAEKKEGKNEPLTPLKEFETSFNFRVSEACTLAGVRNLDELRQVNPAAFAYYKENYPIWRQEAYEKEQEFKTQQARALEEQKQKLLQFQRDMQAAKDATTQNLMELKKEYPELDQHFKESGVNDFLKYLDKTVAWPLEFTLSNDAIAKFLAKAARAIHVLDHLEDKKAEWQQEYEKGIKNAKKAELPTGGEGSKNPKAGMMGRGFGHPGHGVSLRD